MKITWGVPDSKDLLRRFYEENENDAECCACTWASVILAGKRDCLRHSTKSFSDNVVVPFCDQERAQPPSINIKVLTFLGRQKDYEAFRGVYFFENTWKNFKSNLVLLLSSKGFYWLVGRWRLQNAKLTLLCVDCCEFDRHPGKPIQYIARRLF